jgi:dTDP-glucose 4,6-dehydratase
MGLGTITQKRTWLVTGGAGFIGSNFILAQSLDPEITVINLDKLTYAGNLKNLAGIKNQNNYIFVHGDIGNESLVQELLQTYRPQAIINFAAETHVDRSIQGPGAFIDANVVGTYRLLETTRSYWAALPLHDKEAFRFLHVSTDEVYGSLKADEPPFSEKTPYAPNSPYAASKAASDHFVRAYHKTYGLTTLISNCSNNYGPFQFPEKLIPLMILNGLQGKPLPVYGDGQNIRDWLYVGDHCEALRQVLERGRVGETYNIGGECQKTNLEVVHTTCSLLDQLAATASHVPHASLIAFVEDRPGHDRRYAIDSNKIRQELDWRPQETFDSGLRKTVRWYLSHPEWVSAVQTGAYRDWVKQHYGQLE